MTDAISSATPPCISASMLNSIRKDLNTMHGSVIITVKSVSLARISSEKILTLRQ